MKIAIQTLMLYNNYGGILQAFALQKYLHNKGADVIHLKRYNEPASLKLKLKLTLHKLVNAKLVNTYKDVNDVFKPFIDEYINYSPGLKSKEEWANYIKKNNFKAVVVGSDQVWRYDYVQHLYPEFFLDFQNNECKKMSYAASFGVNNLSKHPITRTNKMLTDFDALSVREDNGVDLIKKNFNLKAEHHIDPTILYTSEDYTSFFDLKPEEVENHLFSYVLDKNQFKRDIINTVKKKLNLELSIVYGSEVTKSNYLDKDLLNKPSIEKWLQNFLSAKFIVTDSFHGMLFSIIFHKPFVVIANEQRGVARFTSFLKKLDLLDRLVYSGSKWDTNIINKSIDFNLINQLLDEERKRTKEFFFNNLGI